MVDKPSSAGTKTGLVAAGLTALAILLPSVKGFEGRSLEAYLDVGGVPTICDGITGKNVKIGQTATDTQCDGLLGQRLEIALHAVERNVMVPLSPSQQAGLASFVYNVGESAFRKSTLLKDLNKHQTLSACNRMRVWVYVNGKDCRIAKNKCGGIVRRREAERELCLKV